MRYAKANDVDLDHPFQVHADGSITDLPRDSGIYAPEVWHVADAKSPDDIEGFDKGEWEPLVGYTRQQGYRGAVLHASEFIGGGLEEDILATPGIYVAVVVDVLEEMGDEDHEPAGWAIFRLKDKTETKEPE